MLFFRRAKEKKKEEEEVLPASRIPGLKIEKSLSQESINKARSELRVSSVEKEILSETLTRLYEAAAEGKITATERDNLVSKYREQLSKLDSTLDHSQKIISLYELEETRAELVKMFHDKFNEINLKIDEIRKGIGVVPREVMELKLGPPAERESKPPPPERPPSTPPSPATPRRTKADEVLEKLRQDLQKELEKLEQIEMEA